MRQRELASVNSGVRLTRRQIEKADQLASALGISRNRVIARLIDQAQVVSVPQLEVIVAHSSAPTTEEKTADVHL
jgi:hypothetical protein